MQMPTTPRTLPRLSLIVFLAILVLAWTVPYAIVGHTYPIPTFYAEYAAGALYVLVSVVVGILVLMSPWRRHATSPRIAIVPLAFAALLLVQTVVLHTEQPSMNILGACALLIAAITVHAGYWITQLKADRDAAVWIAWALILGGLFALFCQLVQLFHAEVRFAPFVVAYNVTIDRRPFGNMAQANHLATYISFALAASVYLVQTRRLPFVLWGLLACLYSVGLALTVSRTPWLQTAVIVAIGLAMAWSERRTAVLVNGWQRSRRWLVPLLTLVAFMVMNTVVRSLDHRYGWQLAESAADRFSDPGQISPRLSLWKYGWTMFVTHPLLGVGWGEFPRFQYQLVEQLGRVEIANNSHDVIIDVLAKTGIVGGAIVALGFGFWAWRTLRAPLTTTRLFIFTLLCVLGVHALVEYPQQYLFFLLPAAFLVGLLETRSMTRLPPMATGVGYSTLTLAGVLLAYPVMTDYHRAETLYYGNQPELEYRAAPSLAFGAWGEFGLSTLLPLNTDDLQTKLAMTQRAIALLPGEVVLRRYAIFQALQGDNAAALDQVTRLKIFADALHDWPAQLQMLYKACDQQPGVLDGFRDALQTRYGRPVVTPTQAAAAAADDNGNDDSNDDDDGSASSASGTASKTPDSSGAGSQITSGDSQGGGQGGTSGNAQRRSQSGASGI